MTAFAAALDALLADPNLGETALYQMQGSGNATPMLVIRSSPDRLGEAFGTSLIQATDVLTVAIATLPDLQPGDSFVLAADTLVVQQAERDASGTAWRALCRR